MVSLATTLPEMLASLFSALTYRAAGETAGVDMAIGNAVGSVTANTGLTCSGAFVHAFGDPTARLSAEGLSVC